MLKLIGVLLILNAFVVTAWWLTGEYPYKGWAFTLCLATVFVGSFLVLQERVTEFTVKGIGTIKSAVEQASVVRHK